MPSGQPQSTITIDGTDYKLDDLSETASAQMVNINFVDAQILQLRNEWAIADTARIGYLAALKAELATMEKSD